MLTRYGYSRRSAKVSTAVAELPRVTDLVELAARPTVDSLTRAQPSNRVSFAGAVNRHASVINSVTSS